MKKTYPILILLPLLLVACGKEAPAPQAVERPAATFVLGAQATDNGNLYSGEVHARHETVLGFRIGGKIIERMVNAGAVVKKGQVLARLDSADTGLQASAASAQLKLAREELQRYRELRAQGFVSQSALDAKEAALKAAAAQAGLARNQSGYTTLHADRAGVIAAVLAEAGQVVAAGQPVLRLAPDGEREVAIALPESQLANLEVGAAAEITLLAAGAVPLAGRLRELSPAADPASRRGTPFATIGGERRAVSPALAALADRRRSDWQVLQELAGVVTPFTAKVRAEAEAAVAVAHDQAIAAVKKEYEDRIAGLREEFRAEMGQRIKERLLALAASAQLATPSPKNGGQVKQS